MQDDNAYGIAAGDLASLLSLDAQTGTLFWKERGVEKFSGSGWMRERACKTWNSRFAGKEASSICPRGYVRIAINGKSYQAHRVVFAMTYGRWPDGEVDHINGDPSDNRAENLREVSHLENCRNQKLRITNTTGVCGITVDKRRGSFVVEITDAGTKRHIGSFSNISDAQIARTAAARALNYHPNHGRKNA